VAGWDVAVAIVLLALSLSGCVLVGATGFFLLAFADSCPPQRCNADHAYTWLTAAVLPCGLLVVLAAVGVVVRVVRRRPAWPIAAAVLAVCVAGCGAGLAGEIASLGY
jgi:hypothetical protein